MFQKDRHYSTDLERAVLGACLLEKTAFGRTHGLVSAENFYHDGHRLVFETLQSMYRSGIPIDLFTVVDQLIRVQQVETVEGNNTAFFVTRLTNFIVSTAHLEYHCYVIQTMWVEREIITLTSRGPVNLSGDVRQQLGELQMHLSRLNQLSSGDDWQSMDELMVNLYQHQLMMQQTGGMGLSTGFPRLDEECRGLHPGNMVIIAARPSVGKSAFAGQIAINMATNGRKVGIISLEMNNNEIAARLAAVDTDTDFNVLYLGLYRDEQESKRLYTRIANNTSGLPIWVSDKTNVNIYDIRAKAEKLKAKHGLDALFIDYLQLVEPEKGAPNRNREYEVSQMSRGCKIMAKEMGIPVIVLAQLNREVTKRTGAARYPQLSDLRESGSLEQDGDAVGFLHRDWMNGLKENDNGGSTEYEADFVIRKWRNGKANWILPLDFEPKKMKFSPRREQAQAPAKQISDAPRNYYESEEEDPF